MERNSLETTDIFRGAFFLCKGGDLCGIQMKGNGKRIAYFQIKGEGLARLDKEYRAGRSLVNPLQFRESLNHLRDMLFEKLRSDTGRSRDDDRKRDHRSCQTRY